MKKQITFTTASISEYHKNCGLCKPAHPLVSVINFGQIKKSNVAMPSNISYDFYCINIKKNYEGKIKYGQQNYDFDEGMMTFYAPKQIIQIESENASIPEGWTLVIHPDFLYGTSLASRFRNYGFFSYAVHEALHLSEREEGIIDGIFLNLQQEINNNSIDGYSQDVIISHIELLLNYCNRFYNRQFITRKKVSNDLLLSFEQLLYEYFSDMDIAELPTVHYFSEKLCVSASYLNDMLKNLTGQTTQQHIHIFIIEKAKELLSTTELSVSEIAYQLGFEFPQSFNKLFKNKTQLTPLQFRGSVN